MSETPAPEVNPPSTPGSTQSVGQTTDEGRGRIFPCESCGADLEFHIGQQSLKCPFCGHVKELEFADGAQIVEQDFQTMLQRLAELRIQGHGGEQQTSEVRCESCGGNVVFVDTLTSSECPYCGSPIQRENVHTSQHRVPVDGVLPFLINHELAARNLKRWVESRWFAPDTFRRQGLKGKFNGVYLPYWTFDTMTFNRYTGQRGEHYWVTVGSGKNQRRQRHTRWYPASGSFHRFFDDVLSLAARRLPPWISIALEPWPLDKCAPFTQQVLAGFTAQTYEIQLDQGFTDAKQRIDEAISAEVRRRIGGDEQRIHSINSQYNALTYKHLLLPLWLMAYRYRDKSYQVAINAGTGEVQGERPYSWVKITLAVLAGVIAAGAVALAIYFNG